MSGEQKTPNIEPNSNQAAEDEVKSRSTDLLLRIQSIWSDAQQEIEKIRDIVHKAQELQVKFTESSEVAISSEEEAKTAAKNAADAEQDIESFKQSAESKLGEIQRALSEAESQIQSMNDKYDDFSEIKDRIDDEETGLNAVLVTATDLKSQIENLKSTANQYLEEIQTALTCADEKNGEIEEEYERFTAIREKINDEDEGLEALLEVATDLKKKVDSVKNQSEDVYKDIAQLRNQARDATKEITDFKNEAAADTVVIKKYEEETDDYRQKIIETYNVATGTALANSFDKRKEELELFEKRWFVILSVSTAALILFLALIFYTSLNEQGHIEAGYAFWYKLTFTSPLVFFVAFAGRRYTMERSFLERYAFKAATARALESYTALLKSTFGKDGHEVYILRFVLTSMSSIYQEPFSQKNENKIKWQMGKNGITAEHSATEISTQKGDVEVHITNEEGASNEEEIEREEQAEANQIK